MNAVMKMNNMGAECLRTEHYAQALATFKGAIQGMRALQRGEEMNKSLEDPQANRFYKFAASSIQEGENEQEKEQQPQNQPQQTTALHFKPCAIPSSSASTGGTMVYRNVAIADSVGQSEEEHSRFSAILFYNMALAYQTHDLTQGQNEYLSRSLNLYNMAKDLLFSTVDDYEQDVGFYRLAMGILNNMGTILFDLSNFDKAVACFDQVKVILKGCQQNIPTCDPCNAFRLNSLVMLGAPTHSPAA
jgi:tetratricopeptide (TPR) repeat protein|mmetsp:Transcript_18691/g.24528  ORF Transcript_18691/g.24528 Transcript_18691/m.24528 type:complete len:246 (-) Transcript_18691:91-828(-)|eukprot:CAMPEP_0195264354 /NCGR_PEP_ID=MMETSP0706-20130129/10810_1 /TAXON_ID=33640 /ORGANISM="Asterionellopsis glacialis, Strain CCMP134" /LENGTH=245 /DNA_ID=CAMNT_0040318629 /DNA_START=48 /DNA_END=785 /DNA_ORIENTATION=-